MAKATVQPRCRKCAKPAYPDLDMFERIGWRTNWFTGGSRRQFKCPQGGTHDVDPGRHDLTYGTNIRWEHIQRYREAS